MRRAFIFLAALLAVLVAAGVLLLRSDWFHRQARSRIVTEIENATGGRVELGEFRFDWRTMQAEVRGLVIHGLEGAGEPALFRADAVNVGLKVISLWRRKFDIASLEVSAPRVSVSVDAQGRTNLPQPKVARGPGRALDKFLDLGVGRYQLRQGEFRYGDERWPVDVEGRRLDVQLDYERGARAYAGHVRAEGLRVARPLKVPLALDADGDVRVEADRVTVSRAEVASGQSRVKLSGELKGFERPVGEARFDGVIALADAAPLLKLPVAAKGKADLRGLLRWSEAAGWRAEGVVNAQGLSYQGGGVTADGIAVRSSWRAARERLELIGLRVNALGGFFKGGAEVNREGAYRASGDISGFSIQQLGSAQLHRKLPWAGTLSGPVQVQGPQISGAAQLTITPEPGGAQMLAGVMNVTFRPERGELRFEPSHLELETTRVNFSGDIDSQIEVGVLSRNLDDLLPALALLGERAPQTLPARIEKGLARFEGTVSGGLETPRIRGRFEAGPLLVRDRRAQLVEGDVDANASGVRLTRLRWKDPLLHLQGYATLALSDWEAAPTSAVTAKATMTSALLDDLLSSAGLDYPVHGEVDVQVDVQGSYGAPRVTGHAAASKVEAWQETFESAEADFRYSENLIEVANGRLAKQGGAIEVTGRATGGDWRWEFATRNSRLAHWDAVKRFQPRLDGAITAKGVVTAKTGGRAQPQLTALDGEIRLANVALGERRFGDLTLTSRTRGRLVSMDLAAQLRESRVQGTAEWNLGGNTYGLGQFSIANLTFADIQDLVGEPGKEAPLRGFVNAEVGFAGPILKPESWTGQAKISSVEVEPVSRIRGNLARFVLRNRDPILAYIDGSGITLQSARLAAEGTDLEATGTVAFRSRNPWNLRLRGNLNLPVLSLFEPDLLATGTSTLDATIRGSLDRPNLTGRMELRKATFNFRGIPNGIDNANGVLVFDRTRANIEKLTAQTGGGDLSMSGYVDFGGQQLAYGLQARAQRVRVRYPEDVSTTFNADLNWAGTLGASNLTGTMTINKMGINPRTDIGSLLASAGRAPAAGPSSSALLRGMQVDIRVETASDAELQTSLARDIAPEAKLRLQGSGVRPVLFGRVSVNQGEIQFFGNQYTITRGDISFFNPVRIEPVLDLDLETKVRGITVNMNFSGPTNKLNVSYRSDPPMQSSEIVALLTVGRTPGSGITPNLPQQNLNALQQVGGSNTLLGQAISAPLNSRLQRLFGVSRIKIDPELTGVTNTPQARLTVEQQLSRDITVTYITNLNRTQQQIVRLQWDFSRDYSVLAVRDENGVFGVDFLWRRRFQ